MIAIARGAPGEAVKRLTEYLQTAAPDPVTLALLGDTYTAIRKPALALQQYQRAAVLRPENLALRTKVAVSEFDVGDRREGLEELEKIYSSNMAAVGPTLAFTYLRAGQGDKAAEVSQELLKRKPDSPQYQTLLGMARMAQRDLPAAETIFRTLVQKQPDFVPASIHLANIYVASGKNDEAKKVYKDLLTRQSNDTAALLALADIAARGKQWDEAIAYANQARAAAASDPAPGLKLISLYKAREEWPRATALASELTMQFPSNVYVLHAQGDVLTLTGDQDGAIDAYRRVLAGRPDDPAALNNLAWLYQQKGNLAEARELAERAAAILPTDGRIADTLGWIVLAQGDTERAVKQLEVASAAVPDDPEVKYHLAVALHRLGKTADARLVLQQLLSSGASFTSKADAEKLLNELQRG
jgi:cellulose synthase operon protein C